MTGSLGEKVRDARLARGWSQEQLAVHAGVSRGTVDAIEKDRRRSYQLDKVLRALGLENPDKPSPLVNASNDDLLRELAERLELPVDEVRRRIDAERRLRGLAEPDPATSRSDNGAANG